MSDIDERRDQLKTALNDAKQLDLQFLSEADVRAKLIDPLFVRALGWPEEQIRRERHTTAGEFIDYECGKPSSYFVIEAKKAQAAFRLPTLTHRRTFAIAGLIAGDRALGEALDQAATYCFDEGITYAVVTNGVQLLVFRAMRTDRPWRKGEALVYRSPEELVEHFYELWDVLSYPAVRARSLDSFFAPPDESPKQLRSVISTIQNADERLVRNQLNGELIPVIAAAFDDLTDDTHARALEQCYVHSHELQPVADEFILTIRDLPPKYLDGQVEQLAVRRGGDDGFARAIQDLAQRRRRGAVLVLLGGVGAGKTTFLKQVQVKYCRKVIAESGSYFYIDFRGAPRTPPFESFVFEILRQQLNIDPLTHQLLGGHATEPNAGPLLRNPGVLAELFREELTSIDGMGQVTGATADQIATQKLARLSNAASQDEEIVKRVLRRFESAGRFILIALDNADQHELDYQLKIFLFAQHLAATTGANIICALREEKFYLASQRGAFNAFYTHKFHIPSPRVKDLLAQRLHYALAHLDEILDGVDPARVDDLRIFLNVVWSGCVGRYGASGSSDIVMLLERTCMGNMRRALTMFRRFLRSGNTDVRKIIAIARENARRSVPYLIPFHEFTKSVMLDDRLYYREGETDDEILNLFATSGAQPNSHFTALRILSFLMDSSEVRSASGIGFVEWERIVRMHDDTFGDGRDARYHLERLLYRSLIEADTGVIAPEGRSALDHCRAVRATPSGEYYLTYLARVFAYLDLVWIDTPLADAAVFARLRDLVSWSDKESRFERVDAFLDYLAAAEDRELRDYPQLTRGSWGGPFIPKIRTKIENEKKEIARKFARYARGLGTRRSESPSRS